MAIDLTETPEPSIVITGQLYADLHDAVNSRVDGANPATAMRVFTSQDHGSASYTRNSSLWAAGYVEKLTAISPWNSDGTYTKAGVLVSPRHVLFATHFLPAVSSTIRFVAADNTVITRTVTALESLPYISGYTPDFTVALLDSDVPTSISFAKVLPLSVLDKLPSLASYPVPAVSTDQEEKLQVRNWTYYGASGPYQVGFTLPTSPPAANFYENWVGGDSGSPTFLLVNGELALITVATGGGAGSGTFIGDFISDINAAMTALGGGYQLTEIDLSGYLDL